PGAVLYTHVSGHYEPFYTRVISATMSEAPYVLDGLHHHAHQTDLRIVEHYTDTAGATDHGSERSQALHGREARHVAAARAVDRRHSRNGSDPRSMDRTHAAQGLDRDRRGCSVRHPAQAGGGRRR